MALASKKASHRLRPRLDFGDSLKKLGYYPFEKLDERLYPRSGDSAVFQSIAGDPAVVCFDPTKIIHRAAFPRELVQSVKGGPNESCEVKLFAMEWGKLVEALQVVRKVAPQAARPFAGRCLNPQELAAEIAREIWKTSEPVDGSLVPSLAKLEKAIEPLLIRADWEEALSEPLSAHDRIDRIAERLFPEKI